jgi:hypothetical protein
VTVLGVLTAWFVLSVPCGILAGKIIGLGRYDPEAPDGAEAVISLREDEAVPEVLVASAAVPGPARLAPEPVGAGRP